MERANTNAQQTLMRIKSSRMTDMGMRTQALNEIAEALGLKEAPLRIECYDISNASGGGYQVASMVVFEDGIARKKEYRHFAIRGKDGQGAGSMIPVRFMRPLRAVSDTAISQVTAGRA